MNADYSRLHELDRRFLIHPNSYVGRHRKTGGTIFVEGQGSWLTDTNGRKYLDGTGGLWLCQIGHGRREMAEVAQAQIERLEYFTSFWDFTNDQAALLAGRLMDIAPPGMAGVFYTSGGSESNETSIKLARLYHALRGQPDRNIIISRTLAYHGVSYGALAATGFDMFKKGFSVNNDGFMHVNPPYPGFCPHCTGSCTLACADEIEQAILRVGPEHVAAFIGEPVMGVGGMVPPPPGYWAAVQDICHKYGILLILDEVVTGYGRVGRWFGSQRYDIRADLISTAKGLTSGYAPLGAVLVGERVFDILATDSEPLHHGFTYYGHPLACALALKNLEIIENEDLAHNALEMGAVITQGFQQELARYPFIAQIRSEGMLFAVQMTDDPLANGPFQDGDICNIFMDAGVIIRELGANIVMSPPLSLSRTEADMLVQRIAAGMAVFEEKIWNPVHQ